MKVGIDPKAANSKQRLLGWNGVAVALDYQSLQLALAWMKMGDESEPEVVDNRDQPTPYSQ